MKTLNRRDFLKKTAAAGVALVGKAWLSLLCQLGGFVPPGTPLPGALTDDGYIVPAALATPSMWAIDNFGIAQLDISEAVSIATEAQVNRWLVCAAIGTTGDDQA